MGRFLGTLAIEAAFDVHGKPVYTDDHRMMWHLTRPLSFEPDAGGMVTAPLGFLTDLGSIPQAAWSFGFSPDGQGAPAFVIHDLLYATSGTGWLAGYCWIDRDTPYSREAADAVLLEALAACGGSEFEREAIYRAVRLGGAGGWGH